jgi:hypothetical protein
MRGKQDDTYLIFGSVTWRICVRVEFETGMDELYG